MKNWFIKLAILTLMLGTAVLPAAAQDEVVATPEQQAAFIVQCQRNNGGIYFSTTDLGDDSIYTQTQDNTLRLAYVTSRGRAGNYRREIESLGSVQIDIGKLICANPSEWMAAVRSMEEEVEIDAQALSKMIPKPSVSAVRQWHGQAIFN